MRRTVLGLFVAVVCLAAPQTSRAAFEVAPGFDLFETTAPTNFMGLDFQGVPLGLFDFGGTAGVQDVGLTDTIVERLGPAVVAGAGDTATIDIELVALQLVSVDPVNLGAGLDFHYITLQPAAPSLGQMDITFADVNGGTFSSFFDIFFDIRIGALDGPVIFGDQLQLNAQGAPWGRIPPPGALEIDNVNRFLAGPNDRSHDFWPDPLTEQHPDGAMHSVRPTPQPRIIPEPSTMVIWSLLGALGLTAGWWRGRRAT